MAATGYTPIQLYYSTTASAVPSAGNLASGELAINITDGKLYYKSNAGTVTLLAGSGGGGPAAGSNTQIQFNSSGVFGASSSLTWDGSTLSTTGLTASSTVTLSGGTANGVTYLNGSKVLTSGSALTYNGSTFKVAGTDASIIAGFSGTTKGVRIETTSTGTSIAGVDSAFVNSFEPLDINGSYTTYSTSGTERMRLTSTLLYTASALNVAIGASSVTAGTKFNVTGNNVTFTPNTAGKDTHTFSTGAADVGTYSIKNDTTVNVLLNAGGTSYFNGGSLVVGGTSVAGTERLNVVGGTGIRINEDGVGTKILTLRSDYAGLGPAINVTTSDPLLFLTANAERARIDSSGHVGINTSSTTLSQPLTVNGSGGTLAGTAAIALWDVNSGGSRRWAIANGASATGIDQLGALTFNVGSGSYTADPLTAGLEIARFTSGGFFLVGTTSANGKITSSNSGGTGNYNFYASASNIANPNSTGSEIIGAQYAVGGNIILSERQVNGAYSDRTDLVIRTNTGFGIGQSDKFRFTAGGQFLVGTDTTSGGEVARFQTASGSTSVGIIAATNGSSFVNFGDTSDANVGYIGYDHTNNYMNFRTNGSERIRVSSTGNVSIGTAANQSTLQVFRNGQANPSYSPTMMENAIASFSGGGGDWLSIGQYTDSRIWIQASYQTSSPYNIVFQPLGGSVIVTGALSKGSGSFRISHPLPELEATHELVHSFIEGPQADLIYRGKVTLVNGVASVNIDLSTGMTEGTFVALNRDIQCFTTNESGWAAVRGAVSGNILTIEAQDNMCVDTISWMVIGERQDKHMYETDWTDENGKVILEPLKPSSEQVSQ